ncbi:MAG: glycosyltransferase family 4 protein [Cetobacterium sp.]
MKKMNESKKILFISHSSGGGGAETVFLSVIKSMEKKCEMYISLPSSKGYLYEKLIEKTPRIERNIKTEDKIKKFFKISKILKNIKTIIKLIFFIKKEKVDIIYSSSIVNISGGIAGIITGKKHVWHIHEMANKNHEWFDSNFNWIIKKILKNSTIIFISETSKKSWLEKLKIDEKELNYEVIYNPIKKMNTIRKKKREKIVIGFLGAITKNKNIEFLVDVFCEFYKKHRNIELKIVGDGEQEKLGRYIRENTTEEKITLESYMKAEDFFGKIDILVLPSFSEAFPLVVLEGMSLGIPCFCTTESSLKDLFKDGENLFFIDPFSKIEFQKKIEFLLENFEEYSEKFKENNKFLFEKYKFNENFEEKIRGVLMGARIDAKNN